MVERDEEFKTGDRVTVSESYALDFPAAAWVRGKQGVVKGTDYDESIAVEFPRAVAATRGHSCSGNTAAGQGWWFLAEDLKRIPQIVTPQARTVLQHLQKRGAISPMEALVTYTISRLAACIYELRRAGYDIKTTIKRDELGHKYSRYCLVHRLAAGHV